MVRNIKVYNKHVKKHRKELNYIKALWALRDGRNTNPVHKVAFDSLFSDLIRIGIESQLIIMV